jgi:putative membrane protein
MVISDQTTWKRVLPVYGKSSLAVLGVSVGVAFAVEQLGWTAISLPIEPFSLVGTGLSILLVFRNNEAYGRYWEARTLWGQVMASVRSFCRLSLTLSRPHASEPGPHDDSHLPLELEEMRREWVYRSLAFLNALRTSLRGGSPSDLDFESLAPFLEQGELETLLTQKNGPCALLHTQGERLADAWRLDYLHPLHLKLLDEHITAMTFAYGGCEKIARTPIPPAYTFLAQRIVWGFVLLLPFAMVEELGWKTVVIAPLTAFLFGALQRFGEEVQHPFQTKDDGIALDMMTRQMEIEMRQRLGETEFPAEIESRDSIVL